MVSLVLKPRIPNPDLIPELISVPNSPRNIVLVHQCEIFWVRRMRLSVRRASSVFPPPDPRKKRQSA